LIGGEAIRCDDCEREVAASVLGGSRQKPNRYSVGREKVMSDAEVFENASGAKWCPQCQRRCDGHLLMCSPVGPRSSFSTPGMCVAAATGGIDASMRLESCRIRKKS